MAACNETRVADVMSGGVVDCVPETPLREVARLMVEHNVHAVYVHDENGGLLGLVSDLDLVAAGAVDMDAFTAGTSAVSPIVTVRPDAALADAASLMAIHGIHHLAVIDDRREPIGVVSTLDLARAFAD